MTLRDYWRVIWLRRRWVIAIIIISTLVALGMALTQQKAYVATAQMMYAPPPDVVNAAAGYTGDLSRLGYEVQSVVNTVGSPAVSRQASSLLSEADLALHYSVSAKAVVPADSVTSGTSVSDVVAITARAGSADASARIANAYAKAVIELRKEREKQAWRRAQAIVQSQLDLYAASDAKLTGEYAVLRQQLRNLQIAEASANGSFEVILPAVPPSSPASPKPVKSAAFGFLVGLFLGVVTAFIVDQFDTRVRSPQEAAALVDMPFWGQIRKMPPKTLDLDPLIVRAQSNSPSAEAIRKLRGSLEFANVDGEVKSLFITSALQGEGKTTTVCNLALVLAEAGHRTVLVDGDLRRPHVHRYFGLPNAQGASSVLTGRTSLEAALSSPSVGRGVVTTTTANAADRLTDGQSTLSVLTAGAVPPNPAELVASKSFAALIARLESEFDLVLIDAPALLAVGDTAAMARCVDGLVFLVDLTRARRPLLLAAAAQISQMPCRKLGLVAIGKNEGFRSEQHYSYDSLPNESDLAAPSTKSVRMIAKT